MSENGDKGVVVEKMASVTIKDQAAIERSRAAGWAEPQTYDYEAYKSVSKEDRGLLDQVDLPAWASEAEKFEWKEE